MNNKQQRRKSAALLQPKQAPELRDALADRDKVAVLSLDCQRGFFQRLPQAEYAIVPTAVQVLACARQRLLMVVHAGLGYEAGRPEANFSNPLFRRILSSGGKQSGAFLLKTDSSSNICEAMLGLGDIRLYKTRDSAFAGTELDMMLRAKEMRTVVLMGLSETVLSTALAAYNLDYLVVVIADAVYDADAETRRVLLEKVLPRTAIVCTGAAFADTFAAGRRGDFHGLGLSDLSGDESDPE